MFINIVNSFVNNNRDEIKINGVNREIDSTFFKFMRGMKGNYFQWFITYVAIFQNNEVVCGLARHIRHKVCLRV